MGIFRKAQYVIPFTNVVWVMALSEADQKAAFKIWRQRFERLFEVSLKYYPYTVEYNQLAAITEELFERCNAICWPETVEYRYFFKEQLKDMEFNERFLEYSPPGSYQISKKGKVLKRIVNGDHPFFIGKHHLKRKS